MMIAVLTRLYLPAPIVVANHVPIDNIEWRVPSVFVTLNVTLERVPSEQNSHGRDEADVRRLKWEGWRLIEEARSRGGE